VGIALLAAAPHETLALALLARGDPDAAAERFEQAAEAWALYHCRGELRCRFGVGEALRQSGQLDVARERLVQVESRVMEHQMAPLLARIRRSLRLAGVRRAAPRIKADASGLTGREREILALVGAGLTDVEVARRLGVSRSTVAAQLASASVKLGAANRAQAAVLAAERR
jgi:DNA-binding CsgD family transcriptional regulator